MRIDSKKKIIIVGGGWYGLYSALLLKDDYEIVILEQKSDIFNNSSYYNQNRLHLGYHYPRSFTTREICLNGYDKFLNKFAELVDSVGKNYYIIAKESIIDYPSYLAIFNSNKKYNHQIIENTNVFSNIDGSILETNEKIINGDKAYKYFKDKIDNKLIKFNYKVEKISIDCDNKIIVNDEMEGDFLIDCTYNQLTLPTEKYCYELTISLVYKNMNCPDFGALTCMDGDFFSIFPRNLDENTYTLTHVKYTPLISSSNIENINNYILTEDTLKETIKNMENEVFKYYKDFLKYFKYETYFTSYKCKKISGSSSRDITIHNANNIISVNCGKITGIFALEDYLIEHFDL